MFPLVASDVGRVEPSLAEQSKVFIDYPETVRIQRQTIEQQGYDILELRALNSRLLSIIETATGTRPNLGDAAGVPEAKLPERIKGRQSFGERKKELELAARQRRDVLDQENQDPLDKKGDAVNE